MIKKCRSCSKDLNENMRETNKTRYIRIYSVFEKMFKETELLDTYTRCYIGKSKVNTFVCTCGVVTKIKPHNDHWWM